MEKIILSAKNISKSFGSSRVLKSVDLEIHSNEVHAIIGENGAGKSTFIKALAGELPIDSGSFFLDGTDITKLNVLQIQNLGLQVIHQNLNLVPSLSVEQNILLGSIPSRFGFLVWKQVHELAESALRSISKKISLSVKVETLSIAEQQLVIIARALVRKPKLLILDEPTARLGLEETKQLFELINQMKTSGVTIIYITHRLEELYQICDRVSILRDGEKILTALVSETPEAVIIKSMLGKKLASYVQREDSTSGAQLLEVRNIHLGHSVKDISFSVNRGEIVGLVGSVGAGKSETLDIIFGETKADSGKVILDGRHIDLHKHSPRNAIKNKIAYIPEDRHRQGLVLDFVIRENITLADIHKVTKNGVISRKVEDKVVDDVIHSLTINPKQPEYSTRQLSGGNQQKVSISKWFLKDYDLYLFDELTSGVDVGAKAEIYRIIDRLVDKGSGVIIATSDISESLNLCDRIVVLHRGMVIREFTKEQATRERILFAMMGEINETEPV